MSIIKVSQNSSSDYTSIQEAINNSAQGDVIVIGKGIYNEKLIIDKDNITLIGSKDGSTVITFDDYAFKEHIDGKKYGTFRSYTMFINGSHIKVDHLEIVNSSGDGNEVGQAIALFCQGDFIEVSNCKITGAQDTLFCGPLPEKPKIPNSFLGPTQDLEYKTSRQYYSNCIITGDVDFIFGSGLALFYNCDIISRNRFNRINGYVTAASTWKHEPYGFVFVECQFKGEKGIRNESVYLGRPWRPYAKAWFYKCQFGNHLFNEHFDCWGDEVDKLTTSYKESLCHYDLDIMPKNEGSFIDVNSKVDQLKWLHKWHISKLTSL